MISVKVSNEFEGIRLNKYLLKIMPSLPMPLMYKQLRNKNIVVNNKKVDSNYLLKTNDEINIFFSNETYEKFSKNNLNDLENKIDLINNSNKKSKSNIIKKININKYINKNSIIYEDDNIILLNKEVGILSQKAKDDDYTINEMLVEYSKIKDGSVLNRLDRNTSGLIIFGKSYAAKREISSMLKNRTIEKHYMALCHGILDTEEKAKLIEGFLLKNNKTNKVEIFNKEVPFSRKIKTLYKTIKINYDKKITLLDIELITGASHQIRAHLSAINHPLVGDVKYIEDKNLILESKKILGKENISQCLHSYLIKFAEFENENLKYLSNKIFRTTCPEWESLV